ncbi:ImmA/IrrE family metallo-endopeptidase [Ferrovum sp.]|uniref:ImmA/IrrE family metallo-endopeptidase n=1 Tax=Ferrovum sp. TaxID=2609467 RepID=UPI0026051419|nr:ImmA/IrrE family metallo-endopeptidase [Ferrovum sp.]
MKTEDALPINPVIVEWARKRAGLTIEDASHTFKKIAGWESGDTSPTYPQLEQMADKFKCPVAVFFFPNPPEIPDVEKFFRTLSPEDFASIPRTVRAFLRRGQAMQLNLAELNDGLNPAPRLITRDLRLAPGMSLDEVASIIRDYLGVSLDQQVKWKSSEQALEEWREVFAQVGVYVFKDAFHSKGYFGFCLYNETFPIIYVNNTSAKTRQIFTLFHELGHLLFQTSGVDILDDEYIQRLHEDERKIEVICNGLAAKVLVPDDALDQMLKGMPADREAAAKLADHFCVSREVIYRKMLDRGLIPEDEYTRATRAWEGQTRLAKETTGNYYNSLFAYLGQQYIHLAYSRYYQRRFDDVQLAEYLNIKPKNLPKFEAKFAGML